MTGAAGAWADVAVGVAVGTAAAVGDSVTMFFRCFLCLLFGRPADISGLAPIQCYVPRYASSAQKLAITAHSLRGTCRSWVASPAPRPDRCGRGDQPLLAVFGPAPARPERTLKTQAGYKSGFVPGAGFVCTSPSRRHVPSRHPVPKPPAQAEPMFPGPSYVFCAACSAFTISLRVRS